MPSSMQITGLLGTTYSLPGWIVPGSSTVSSSASLTAPSPASGLIGVGTGNFTFTPSVAITGTVTLTPSGTAASGLSAVGLTYAASSASQSASWTPTVGGTLTVTATYSGTPSLTLPSPVTYAVGNVAMPSATAGLTPGQAAGYTVYSTSGVVSHVRTTSGVTEIGNGVYYANIVVLLPSDALVVWDDTQGRYAPMLLY